MILAWARLSFRPLGTWLGPELYMTQERTGDIGLRHGIGEKPEGRVRPINIHTGGEALQ